MKLLDTDNLIALLCRFNFWSIQTQNRGERGGKPTSTRYYCTIRHDHRVYQVSRSSPLDAIRAAIEKASAGPMPRKRSGEAKPFMRLAGT